MISPVVVSGVWAYWQGRLDLNSLTFRNGAGVFSITTSASTTLKLTSATAGIVNNSANNQTLGMQIAQTATKLTVDAGSQGMLAYACAGKPAQCTRPKLMGSERKFLVGIGADRDGLACSGAELIGMIGTEKS